MPQTIHIRPDPLTAYVLTTDGLSLRDEVNVMRSAVRSAARLYMQHLSWIYRHPVLTEAGANVWWFHPATQRIDNFRDRVLWAYAACAQVRAMAQRGASALSIECDLPADVERTITTLAQEAGLACLRTVKGTVPAPRRRWPGRARRAVATKSWAGEVLAVAHSAALAMLRPCVARRMRRAFGGGTPILFCLHGQPELVGRYNRAPQALRNRGHRVCFFRPVSKPKHAIGNALAYLTGRTDCINAEVFGARRRYHGQANRLCEDARQALESARCPQDIEFVLFAEAARQARGEDLSPALAMWQSLQGLARRCPPGVWLQVRPFGIDQALMTTAAARQAGHRVIAVAPHFYTHTRVTNLIPDFTHDIDRLTLPDAHAVRDFHSRDVLIQAGVAPQNVHVIGHGDEPTVAEGGQVAAAAPPQRPPGSPLVLLVLLQGFYENEGIVGGLLAGLACVDGVDLLLKPHPSHPLTEELWQRVRRQCPRARLASSAESLAALAEQCHAGLTVYSTAVIPVIARGRPVIWLAYAGRNFAIGQDYSEKVGFIALDPADFRATLIRLRDDPAFYRRAGEQSLAFARDTLAIGAPGNVTPLEDVVERMLTRPA